MQVFVTDEVVNVWKEKSHALPQIKLYTDMTPESWISEVRIDDHC
jgi:hypothetical protein